MTGKWLKGILNSKPSAEFGKSWGIDPPFKIEKPCHYTGYCPYGSLVEEFPLYQEACNYAIEHNILTEDGYPDLNKVIPEHPELDKYSCQVFGHDCPVFYMAEPLAEDSELRENNEN